MATVTPIKNIRVNLFGATQAEFALIAGSTQPTVSKWERGELSPNLEEAARIAREAKTRGLDWNSDLFFGVPAGQTDPAPKDDPEAGE